MARTSTIVRYNLEEVVLSLLKEGNSVKDIHRILTQSYPHYAISLPSLYRFCSSDNLNNMIENELTIVSDSITLEEAFDNLMIRVFESCDVPYRRRKRCDALKRDFLQKLTKYEREKNRIQKLAEETLNWLNRDYDRYVISPNLCNNCRSKVNKSKKQFVERVEKKLDLGSCL